MELVQYLEERGFVFERNGNEFTVKSLNKKSDDLLIEAFEEYLKWHISTLGGEVHSYVFILEDKDEANETDF